MKVTAETEGVTHRKVERPEPVVFNIGNFIPSQLYETILPVTQLLKPSIGDFHLTHLSLAFW